MEEVLTTENVIKEKKSDAVSYLIFAKQFMAEQQFSKAIKMCDKALQLEPNNTYAIELKEQIIKAKQALNAPKTSTSIIDI